MAVQWTRRNVKTRAAKRRRLENESGEDHKQGENRVPHGNEINGPQASASDGSTSSRKLKDSSTVGSAGSVIKADLISDCRSEPEATHGSDIGEPSTGECNLGEVDLKGNKLERKSEGNTEHNSGNSLELNPERNSECSLEHKPEHRSEHSPEERTSDTHGSLKTTDLYGTANSVIPGAVVPDSRKVRSTMVDYQRDICTQYMKTGRCRYGDACKFAHERGTKTRVLRPSKPAEPLRIGCSECSTTINMVVPPCNHQYCETCFFKISKANDPCRICSKPLKSAKPLDY